MKKYITSIFVLVAVFFGLFFLSSCTKEYTCECKMTYSGNPGLPNETVRDYKIRDTKKEAESKCAGNSATYEKDGITTVEDCKLW